MSESSKPRSAKDGEVAVVSAVYVQFQALQASLRRELTGDVIEASLSSEEARALRDQLTQRLSGAKEQER